MAVTVEGTKTSMELRSLVAELHELRDRVAQQGSKRYGEWRHKVTRRSFRPSALNLAAYVALRRHDLRALQSALMPYGLSSLGRCEARVIANLDAVLWAAASLCGEPPPVRRPAAAQFFRGECLLRANTDALFGTLSGHRRTRIMVTLSSDQAADYASVRRLVSNGMDCARINCAHDTPAVWLAMVANVRRASAESGRACAVCADIAGPRLRTGEVRLPVGRERASVNDRIFLAADAAVEASSEVFRAAISLPSVLGQLKAGESACIDEGRIECRIDEVREDGAMLSVRRARPKGEKLRSEKGLNFPESSLSLPALTPSDLQALDVLAPQVDMIGYSFVKTAHDVALLKAAIEVRRPATRPPCGIVLKIETAKAISNLPELIVRSAGAAPTAVMIARGDLAIEIGYRRLAEMQEEILWLCEAAHVPVIWATQVLDYYIKKGRMSRAEFTDAAMAERADCVMLNKGPFVAEAVSILDDVLARMEGHQIKKTSRLRALHSW
jgi:pyruvate kinase